MRATRNPGRIVGLWYLTLVLTGPLTLLYIPDKLFVLNDAAATAANIAADQGLFKTGMLADLLGSIILIFLVLAFYRLFKDVDRELAVTLVIAGGIMPATLMLVNFVNSAVVRAPARARDHGARDPLGALALPDGILSYKSGFLPRFIGVWLLINGATYRLLSLSRLRIARNSRCSESWRSCSGSW